jgi:hypothetical protein
MNPTASELLAGSLAAMNEPAAEAASGDFAIGKLSVIGLISFLCAQEAESGAAVRHAENDGLRALFAEAANEGWAPALTDELAALAKGQDLDFTISGLDTANAALRRALIRLQTAVEADGRRNCQRRILSLLLDHARARALALPGQAPAP